MTIEGEIDSMCAIGDAMRSADRRNRWRGRIFFFLTIGWIPVGVFGLLLIGAIAQLVN